MLVFSTTLTPGLTMSCNTDNVSDDATPAALPAGDKDNCTFIFKKSAKSGMRNVGRQKRKESSSSEDETSVVKKQRKKMNPNLMQTTLKSRKDKPKYSDSSDSNESDSTPHLSYRTSGTGQRLGPRDMGATSTLEIDTEKDKDAQAIFERSEAAATESRTSEEVSTYKGLDTYGRGYVEARDTAQGNASSGMVRRGPIRAPDNIRSTIRWDYQPDICKDYKETGYCGFGDSCKFLHDRSDYKHGWQLERDWKEKEKEERSRRRKKPGDNDDADNDDPHKYEVSDSDDELPFKCLLCRESFNNPIVTKCKHYFCEECALKQYRKSQRCYACGKQTFGVFNPAKEVIKKLRQEHGLDDGDDD